MKITKTRLLTISIALLLVLALAACGGSKSALVGVWENAVSGGAGLSSFTLHSDGTGITGTSGHFTWSVKGDRMTWESDISDLAGEYTYKLSGNALTLTHTEWGTVYSYKK